LGRMSSSASLRHSEMTRHNERSGARSARGAVTNGLPVVVHSMRKFLPMSQNWIYPQITALQRYRPVVFTSETVNAGSFPLPPDCLRIVPHRHRKWAEGISSLLGLGRDTPTYWRRALGPARAQLVHSHFGNRGYLDMAVVRRMRLPQVVTFYGHDLSTLPRNPIWMGRFHELFSSATLFTVEGPHMRDSLVAVGCPDTKVRVRRHGVDLEECRFVPRRIGADGAVKVLVAARFVEKKGVPQALRAVAEVALRHPELRLTVVGDAGPDDAGGQEIRREVQSLLQSAPLHERSRWIGSVAIQEFMRIALEHHILVQPSLHARDGDNEGGAPVTLIQLAATGMPIVATTHCDIPEIVLDGVTGALAPERDVRGLAASLERIVASPQSWPRLGEQARHHVRNVFEMSKSIADLEAIYDEAVQAGR
jgi:colanic acid/amylovoran biosynthesis glycosyltransferase